jgi:hypothetical protein
LSALLVTPRFAEAAQRRHDAGVSATSAVSGAAATVALPPTERPVLFDGITLRVPGSSRFGGTVRGRDTVVAHLRAMGIRWEALSASKPLVSLAPNDELWLATIPLQVDADAPLTMSALISATRNARGEIASLDLFIHDEAQLARRAPREDGVQRTSLAAQRNLRQVRALHGNGRATRFLGANGARVVAILHAPHNGPPQIVEYRFDAAGHVVSLHSAPPACTTLRETRCDSGDTKVFAELLAVLGPLQ